MSTKNCAFPRKHFRGPAQQSQCGANAMHIAFLTLFLGLTSGVQPFEAYLQGKGGPARGGRGI